MSAIRGFNKVIKRCPRCGKRGPKELVEGPKQFNTLAYILVAFLTCGLGLLLFPLFYVRYLEAYCDDCGESFSPD